MESLGNAIVPQLVAADIRAHSERINMTTCFEQYDTGVAIISRDSRSRRNRQIPLSRGGPAQSASSIKRLNKGESKNAHEFEADGTHDHHFNSPCLTRSCVPPYQSMASVEADLRDATSRHIQTYNRHPNASIAERFPLQLSPSHSSTEERKMNYSSISHPYPCIHEEDMYMTSCDFLYPSMNFQFAPEVLDDPWVSQCAGTAHNNLDDDDERPHTGSSSMSTPQLSTSQGREASCSPLSIYDDSPDPIIYPTIAGFTGLYMAPSIDSRDWGFPNAHESFYKKAHSSITAPLGDLASGGYPEHGSQYEVAEQRYLSQGDPDSCSASTWTCIGDFYGAHMPNLAQPPRGAESFSNWFNSPSSIYTQLLEQTGRPSSLVSESESSLVLHTTAETATIELHHPRPQRGFPSISWQMTTDSEADEFLATMQGTTSGTQPSSMESSCGADATKGGEFLDHLSYSIFDAADEMQVEWQIGRDESPRSTEGADLHISDSTTTEDSGVHIGRGIGLGLTTGALSSDSILYKPVAASVRQLNDAEYEWTRPADGHYDMPALGPSFP